MYTRNNPPHLPPSPSTYLSRPNRYDSGPQEEPHSRFQSSAMGPSDTTPKKRVIQDRLETGYGRNNSMQISGKQNMGQNWARAQQNAEVYEQYSHSPLKQSMGMYNSSQFGRSRRNIKHRGEQFNSSKGNPLDVAGLTFSECSNMGLSRGAENNKEVNPTNMGCSIGNSRRRIVSNYNINQDRGSPLKQTFNSRRQPYYEDNCRTPEIKDYSTKKDDKKVQDNKYGNSMVAADTSRSQNTYSYLKKEGGNAIGKSNVETNNMQNRDRGISTHSIRTPRRDVSPSNQRLSENAASLIEKSQLIKQKIDKLSRMTPKSIHQYREQINFNEYPQWHNKNNNIYFDAENENRCSPISSKYSNGGNSAMPSTVPTPNNQYVKEQINKDDEQSDDGRPYHRYEKVERVLDYETPRDHSYGGEDANKDECQVERISLMSKKISNRLKSIIERHG